MKIEIEKEYEKWVKHNKSREERNREETILKQGSISKLRCCADWGGTLAGWRGKARINQGKDTDDAPSRIEQSSLQHGMDLGSWGRARDSLWLIEWSLRTSWWYVTQHSISTFRRPSLFTPPCRHGIVIFDRRKRLYSILVSMKAELRKRHGQKSKRNEWFTWPWSG